MANRNLSGMAHSISYIAAALGPILLGPIAEWSNGWTVPLVILMIVSLTIAFLGTISGKDEKIKFEAKQTR